MVKKIHRDPVCGKKMNRQKAQIIIKHKGYGYLHCCPRCQSEFEQNPDEFAQSEYAYKIPANKKERGRQIK